MNDTNTDIEKSEDKGARDEKTEQPESIPEWEKELDSYPLREKTDDPRWAVRIVWIWIGFALTALTFILVLLVLGAIYD
jgi:hypothetical protein